jgi:hypothetical protein
VAEPMHRTKGMDSAKLVLDANKATLRAFIRSLVQYPLGRFQQSSVLSYLEQIQRVQRLHPQKLETLSLACPISRRIRQTTVRPNHLPQSNSADGSADRLPRLDVASALIGASPQDASARF